MGASWWSGSIGTKVLSTAWLKNCVPRPPQRYLAQNGAGHVEVRRADERHRGAKRAAEVVLRSTFRLSATLQLPPMVSTSPSTRVTLQAPLCGEPRSQNRPPRRRPGSARSRMLCCTPRGSCTAPTAACAAAAAARPSRRRAARRRRTRRSAPAAALSAPPPASSGPAAAAKRPARRRAAGRAARRRAGAAAARRLGSRASCGLPEGASRRSGPVVIRK